MCVKWCECNRAAFEDVRERCDKLLTIFFDLGVNNNVNVDNLLLRESMDVIGESPPPPRGIGS